MRSRSSAARNWARALELPKLVDWWFISWTVNNPGSLGNRKSSTIRSSARLIREMLWALRYLGATQLTEAVANDESEYER